MYIEYSSREDLNGTAGSREDILMIDSNSMNSSISSNSSAGVNLTNRNETNAVYQTHESHQATTKSTSSLVSPSTPKTMQTFSSSSSSINKSGLYSSTSQQQHVHYQAAITTSSSSSSLHSAYSPSSASAPTGPGSLYAPHTSAGHHSHPSSGQAANNVTFQSGPQKSKTNNIWFISMKHKNLVGWVSDPYWNLCFFWSGVSQRGHGPPPSLAEQLKQVLAERERRMSTGDQSGSSRDGSSEYLDRDPAAALAEEIRQAVNEANARGMFLSHAILTMSNCPPF